MWVIVLLKKILSLLFALLFSIFGLCGTAQAAEFSFSSAIVTDAETNTVLYESNANEERAVASTTKIMTTLLLLESGRLDESVTVMANMLDVQGSALGLKAGDVISGYDLAVGMMLVSGNDAANVSAFFVSGSLENFAALMNKKAQELGMKNTYFVTPSGLDKNGNHSTAYDMALLASAAIKNELFAKICKMKSADITISGKKITVYNHNKLLSYDDKSGNDFIGIKTGYTDKAGRCLVTAREYKGNILICVTLNCPDDWNAHIYYTKQCFKKYSEFNAKGSVKIPVVGGSKDYVSGVYKKKYFILGNARIEEYYYPFIYAPIKKDDILGYAVISANGNIIERLPIKANEDIGYYAKQQSAATSKVYG